MGTNYDGEFAGRCRAGSDIAEHLPLLSDLASQCGHVTEFGVRSGNSTLAFLHGLARRGSGILESYDIEQHQCEFPTAPSGVSWNFTRADTSALGDIAPTSMLFIDSLHTMRHVAAELEHASSVERYLVFHDTTTFGGNKQGDNGEMGICPAIWDFLCSKEGNNWRVHMHNVRNNGLLVLKRA